jgi:beta-carotene 3-hydroxylase
MSPLPALVLGVVAFVAMEPITYLLHRYVMHGVGFGWHRSHHRRRLTRFERNDRYPVVLAATTITVMAIGATVPALAFLVPVAAGVTAYGAVYLFVHDGYIHRRLPGLTATWPVLEQLARAHVVHHRFGEEPYGMLVPVVPARLRARLAGGTRPEASTQAPMSVPAAGQQPDQRAVLLVDPRVDQPVEPSVAPDGRPHDAVG